MNEKMIYTIWLNGKEFGLGHSPINRFNKLAMIAFANSVFNRDDRIESVVVEEFYYYMPNVPGKIIFELMRG